MTAFTQAAGLANHAVSTRKGSNLLIMTTTKETTVHVLKAALKAKTTKPVFHRFMYIPTELVLGVIEMLPWRDLRNLILTKNKAIYEIWCRYRKYLFTTVLVGQFPIFQDWFFATGPHVTAALIRRQQHWFAIALGEDQGFSITATYESNLNEVRKLNIRGYLHHLDQFKLQIDKDLESFRRLNRNGNTNLDAAFLEEAVLRRALFLLRRLRWRDLQAYEPREVFRQLRFSPTYEEGVRMMRSHTIVRQQPESDRTVFLKLLETMACAMIDSWGLSEEARRVYQHHRSALPQYEGCLKKLVRWHLCGLLVSVILRIGVQNTERLLMSEHRTDKAMIWLICVVWKGEIDLDLRRMVGTELNRPSHSMLGCCFCRFIGMWRP